LIVIMDNMPELWDNQRLPQCDSPTNPDDDGNPEDWVVGLPYYGSRLRRHSHCRNLRPAD